uniref:SERTA domain-containing protein n=1 Tax=Anser brachyrhynchus TaxID=132585 RepID=A0A8B9BVY5_9AVES
MLGRGLKRKLSDYEENMAGLSSRQLVLNMCLTKLQTYKMLVEPNLHRSVLIANTVQQESNCCDLRSAEDQIENSLLIVSDDDMSSAISSILKDLDFVEDISPPTCLGAECVFGSFEISNSTSYLKDLAIDDIFEDIDTSMYDSDFCCPPLMPPRPPPLATEEPLKTFPSCNSSSANNIQICRTDLSELDHIMEILVGS